MNISKLIEIFDEMDVSKPFSFSPRPQMGRIKVQDTGYSLMQQMFELKKNIGELSDSAKLKYLYSLNLPIPKRIVFDTDNDRVNIIEQSFFQDENDWYDFIVGYTAHLQNILSSKDGNKSQTVNIKENDNLDDRLMALDQKFKVKHVVTPEEAEGQSNGRFKPGDIGFVYPSIPPDPKEAFKLFKDYYATYQFEVQKSLFLDKYRSFENENAITAEIENIEGFINDAEKISYKDVYNNLNSKDQRYEYRRLTGRIYDDHMMTSEQHNVNSIAACVYGRYVLFYDYLKERIKNLNLLKYKGSGNTNNDPPPKKEPPFTNPLDFYFNTPDLHFNKNAQFWYFEFNGKKKPDTKKSFIVIIKAIYDVYFFIEKNLNTPFACIDEIKRICVINKFQKKEQVIIVDRILGIISNNFNAKKYEKVFIQIVDYRESLKSYADDISILTPLAEFDFKKLKEELAQIGSPKDKLILITNTLIDFRQKMHTMDQLELMYYENTKFLINCNLEIERIETLNKLDTELKKDVPIEKTTAQQDVNIALKFADIFSIMDWAKYIHALSQTKPPLISKDREFIGSRKKHIGVICSWIVELKNQGLVKQTVSRSNLATVLNTEIRNFNMGVDGKTFDNISNEYRKFKQQLEDITK